MEIKSLLLPIMLASLGLSSEIVAAGAFVPDDQVISDPAVSLVDPEIDQINHRIAWQNETGELWVADLDADTAELTPTNGMGTLVDTNLASLLLTLNGPEWAYGQSGNSSSIVYTKSQSFGFNIAAARQLQNGSWGSNSLQNSFLRFVPIGTPSSNTTAAKTVYFQYDQQSNQRYLAWRNINKPETEGIYADGTVTSGRWVEDLPLIIFTAIRDGIKQVVTYDTENNQAEQLTFDPTNKYLPYIWFAPENGELMMMVMLERTDIGIYQLVGSTWSLIYQFTLPTSKPFVHSPEPFVYEGKSYIVMVAADQLGSGGSFPGTPVGPTEIWVAGIDSAIPFFRRIDNPAYQARRLDPEIFITTNDAVALYTEQDRLTRRFLLKRAHTGLASGSN